MYVILCINTTMYIHIILECCITTSVTTTYIRIMILYDINYIMLYSIEYSI